MDAVDRMQQRQRQRQALQDQAKSATSRALKKHTPEFVPTVRALADRFGIAGVQVEADGQVWTWPETFD